MEQLTKVQQTLLQLLAEALHASKSEAYGQYQLSDSEWEELLLIADKHAVLPLLYEVMTAQEAIPKTILGQVTVKSRRILHVNYRMLFLTRHLVTLLEKEAIGVCVLKGVGVAADYPFWELRKSGDIDLLVADEKQYEKACTILKQAGLQELEEAKVNHHKEFGWRDGIVVELHSMLAEPFDNTAMNEYLSRIITEYGKTVPSNEMLGMTVPIAAPAYQAYQLMIHMLQHYLRAGFGLKLLCDWVVFWNQKIGNEDKSLFEKIITESRLRGFCDIISQVCIEYLGLPRGRAPFVENENAYTKEEIEEFLNELLEAEEFGNSSRERMVTLRGTSIHNYVQEFHHQMHLNYPKAGRHILLWPALWIMTLVTFLKNNRQLRGVATKDVLRKAALRGQITKKLRLFK